MQVRSVPEPLGWAPRVCQQSERPQGVQPIDERDVMGPPSRAHAGPIGRLHLESGADLANFFERLECCLEPGP